MIHSVQRLDSAGPRAVRQFLLHLHLPEYDSSCSLQSEAAVDSGHDYGDNADDDSDGDEY